MRKPTVISMGLVIAAEPDTNPTGVDWKPLFEEMGFQVCGQIQVRMLDKRFDAPLVLELHEDAPISFDPETQLVSLTAPVLWKGQEPPFWSGKPDVTALIVDQNAGFRRPRSVVDQQDAQRGLKA